MNILKLLVGLSVIGIAHAQVPGQPGAPAINLPQSNAAPLVYASGGGGSASLLNAGMNRAFRFKTSTTTSTSVTFNWAGGGYSGSAGPYVPTCVSSLETAAAGNENVTPTSTNITISWASTTASVIGDVSCQ